MVTNTPDSLTSSGKSVCSAPGTYFLEDSSSCSSYYLCNNGKETKMACQEKTLFSSETSRCEAFETVFCGARPVNLADKNQCSLNFWENI